ncbi:WecB/TagA/CpsF family glycosyltransferase [Bacteroides reticulotermitis]|uniref:N-acetylmannosaminyltransferase n=2 Tax=Bacteroides reticulotermitis TaxID=1133319 RepID=W4UTF0_9BACE|nr:WecB/TagA/CpsF family glycosyltransferase [Bacteroides reticulotermitis]MBB4045540.1 exopolysaccharide biosynthesis WecB/TagA/CpsF family protein [Bacteroides reticulotermitis]GAE84490.1 N-acetylmannosaminyltransferase [Bacteroides reticulotermitis JCM 10512]
MAENVVRVLNVNICSITQKELLNNLRKGFMVTPNIDHLVKLQKDKEFYNVYQQADWVVCDSKVLYLMSKLLKETLPEAIPGSSFFTAFYQYHKDNENCKIFLLGAAKGIAIKAMAEINKAIGREIVVGALSPSYGFEKNEVECNIIIDIIRNSGANVLLVGVGAPKQEKWIAKYREKLPEIELFMGLGATIDFEAKTLKRAPVFWQRIGLEWLFRCIKEPRRLLKRYFVDDMKFFYYFGKQLFGKYENPFE